MIRLLQVLLASGLLAGGLGYGQSAVSEATTNGTSSEIKSIEPAQPPPPPADADSTDAEITLDPASLLPDLPQLPSAKATLIGGTIERIDRVQDQLTVRVFGGGRTSFLFDPRSHVSLNGKPGTVSDLRPGESVYADTILDNGHVFARNLRLMSRAEEGETQGVLISYRADKGELTVRDPLFPEPLRLRVTGNTQFFRGDQGVDATNLKPGSLISLKFGPSSNGHDTVRQVSILASQGETYTFVGRVTTLDLRNNLLVVTSPINHKNYEIVLDPSVITIAEGLREGSEVTVTTRFEGNRYIASRLTLESNKLQ